MEDNPTRILWITMLAMADKNGEVQSSVPGLARVAGVSIEDCRKSLAKFLAPDPDSRTKDLDGRRIEEIDGGWALVNHAKYRAKGSKEEAKASNAERQRRWRAKQREKVTVRNATVTDSDGSVTHRRDIAEADTEAEAKADTNPPPKPKPKPLSETQKRIAKLFCKRDTALHMREWDKKLWASFSKLDIHPEDLSLMERFYAVEETETLKTYRRQSLSVLLNNWDGEVSRADEFFKINKPTKQAPPKNYFN